MRELILAEGTFARAQYSGDKMKLTVKAIGGLHNIKANRGPYFTLTLESHRKGFPNQCYSGGCAHETILQYWPRFADLAALHLSDANGVPMHAFLNGWYYLAGSLPNGANERHHAGNSGTKCLDADECLKLFADHARVTREEAHEVNHLVMSAASMGDSTNFDWRLGREWFRRWIEEQKPRWKAEAEACIAKHGLMIYGDPL